MLGQGWQTACLPGHFPVRFPLAAGLRRREKNGAREGTRTPTPVKASGPKPGASTNFATLATSVRLNLLPEAKEPCERNQ